MNVEQARFNMIEQQIRPWSLHDERLRDLLSQLHREDFCPPAQRAMAFADLCLPLSDGQIMLSPREQARLVQEAQVRPGDRVLQIGAGTGFVTALLAALGAQVTAWEIRPQLADAARANLRTAGLQADVRTGDGLQATGEAGAFDAIVLCGSTASVPQTLLAQLADGGRLIAATGQPPVMHVVRISRQGDALHTAELWDTLMPRLDHAPEAPRFVF